MAASIVVDFLHDVDEETTERFGFDAVDEVGADLPLSGGKVYIYIADEPGTPIWVNGRDGGVSTGLSIIGNKVDFNMSKADNRIVDRTKYACSGFETHIVRFELNYNAGADNFFVHYRLKIKDLAHLPVGSDLTPAILSLVVPSISVT